MMQTRPLRPAKRRPRAFMGVPWLILLCLGLSLAHCTSTPEGEGNGEGTVSEGGNERRPSEPTGEQAPTCIELAVPLRVYAKKPQPCEKDEDCAIQTIAPANPCDCIPFVFPYATANESEARQATAAFLAAKCEIELRREFGGACDIGPPQAACREKQCAVTYKNANCWNLKEPTEEPPSEISEDAGEPSEMAGEQSGEGVGDGGPTENTGELPPEAGSPEEAPEMPTEMTAERDAGPSDMMPDGGPAEMMGDAGPAESMGDAGPAEMTGDTGPVEVMGDAGPSEMMGDAGSAERREVSSEANPDAMREMATEPPRDTPSDGGTSDSREASSTD